MDQQHHRYPPPNIERPSREHHCPKRTRLQQARYPIGSPRACRLCDVAVIAGSGLRDDLVRLHTLLTCLEALEAVDDRFADCAVQQLSSGQVLPFEKVRSTDVLGSDDKSVQRMARCRSTSVW